MSALPGETAGLDPAPRPEPGAPRRRVAASLARRACVELASVAVAIVVVTGYVQLRPTPGAQRHSSAIAPPASVSTAPAVAPPVAVDDESATDTEPGTVALAPAPPAAPPGPDPVKVAAAEKALDAVSRDRARSDAREAKAARLMAGAADRAAVDALRARKLAFHIRDPSPRIAQAVARGGFIQGERDKLAKEVATLRSAPRAKSVSILSKSPVARPVADNEYHFELRKSRITPIDLEKLMKLTKADAQMRVRMSDRVGVVSNKVGPVGAFSLAYELAPTMPMDLDGLIERRGGSRRYELQGWELIPEADNRGETYEATRNPISEFTLATNRINPRRATVTLWVYPDSFELYRRVRADLIERGYSVAARPLPAGLSIRGSPMGSQSAAQ